MTSLSPMRKTPQTFDLSIRVRPAPGRGECMTSACQNPPTLSVTVTDERTGRKRSFQACPECRSTAMLHILEGR